MPGIATAPLVNCQWVKAADGPYEFALDVTANVLAPDVPISAELKPYKIGG